MNSKKYDLAKQAYVFSFPWAFLAQIRYVWVKANADKKESSPYMAFNRLWHARNIITAEYRDGGSPNNDTLYTVSVLDLSKEPIILSVPDLGDRYFTFEFASMNSDNFGYVGKRTTGSKAGNYAIIGPNWKGKLPEDVQSMAPSTGYRTLGDTGLPYVVSPTNHVIMLGRTAVRGPEDVPAVNRIQDQYKLTPLSLWGKPDAELPPEDHEIWKPFNRQADPLADWRTINKDMVFNPPMAQFREMVEEFKTVGVGPGIDVDSLDEETREILAQAAKDGLAYLKEIAKSGGSGKKVNGWSFPPDTMGSAGYFRDFETRAAIQCMLGIISNDVEEAVYPLTHTDVNGETLTGEKKYQLYFAPGQLPNVSEFWSLTMYDMTNNLVPNPLNRYAIGSLAGNYKLADDGSLTIYIQHESPGPEKEVNWLPAPEGVFWMVFRAYGPGKDILEHTWELPGVTPVK
jgi:hypothetical protein